MEDVFAIIGIFGCIPLVTWIIMHHKVKARAKSADIINTLINKDKDISPELVKSIGFVPARAHGDLRTSLILGAIGVALFILGNVIPEEEAQTVFGGLAAFPLLIGIALFVFWYFVSRKEDN